MPHYNSYDSFKTRKSVEKKQKARDKSFNKKNDKINDFIVDSADKFGTVIEVKYNSAYVMIDDEIVLAKLRKDMNLPCNQVIFPGDKVILLKNDDGFVITNMIKRTSMLTRIKKDATRHDDIGLIKNIASNVDLAVIVVSAKEPPLHSKFIDRYLIILQNSNIPAIICLNKCDLKTDKEKIILDVYRKLGIPVIETSTYKNIGIEELKSYLDKKQAIFVGNSGVGKSSLTNAIMNMNEVKIGHISDKSKRGRHTTTSSKYYVWNDDSSIIDTPGIRSLDVSSFELSEIQNYFPEFDNWKQKCKYKKCLHYIIPVEDCGVKEAVKSGIINKMRYESYIKLISSMVNDDKMDEVLKELEN